MAVITRQAATVTSPFGGGGAVAWNTFSTSGGNASASASSSNGGASSSQLKTCAWSNFGAALSNITLVRFKYDWSWEAGASGNVDTDGSCSASGDAGGGVFSGGAAITLNGPGPVGDNDTDGASGSADINLPINTVLSSLSTDAFCSADAESGIVGSTGSANGSSSVSMSSVRVEVTVREQSGVICCM